MRKALSVLWLAAVVPVLIGHGASWPDSTCQVVATKKCPGSVLYSLYGSARVGVDASPTTIQRTLRIAVNDEPLRQYEDLNGYGNSYPLFLVAFKDIPGSEASVRALRSLRLAIDGESGVGVLGETWLYDNSGHNLKLTSAVTNSATGVFFDVTFLIGKDDYDAQQQSSMGVSSQYTLAGGPNGAEFLQVGTSADVYLNENLILTSRINLAPLQPPLKFQANPEDVLRIVVEGAMDTSELWLFKPSGQGVKLLHRARVESSGPRIDVRYRIN
jgi:hypothetical protein